VAEGIATPTTIAALDGYELAADVWSPSGSLRPALTVVINSAMGVARRYYRPFASHLAARGMAVVTYDYRGIGDSAPPRLRGFPARARDWGQLDFGGVLAWIRGAQPSSETAVVGHSIGGQLLALASDARQIRRAVLVAAQAGSWRHWPGWSRAGMAALWYGVIPALSSVAGRLPMSWFGLGEDVPAGVAREWAAWGRAPDSLFDPRHGLDLSGHDRLAIPLRMYSFADDGYAPRPSVEALLRHYPAARIEHLRWVPAEHDGRAVGHFGFFRPGVVPELWKEVADWLTAPAPDQGTVTAQAARRVM
jgi:predicted alpha/beta hydrolase